MEFVVSDDSPGGAVSIEIATNYIRGRKRLDERCYFRRRCIV